MRSFFDWQILTRIETEPKRYLKQRNYKQLQAFLLGYSGLGKLRVLENEDYLAQKYQNFPAISNFVMQKYQNFDIGTRHFTCLISLTCEDDREFFERYFAILHEYELAYPIKETLNFISVSDPDFCFSHYLHLIKLRPAMYFGNFDLANLRAFFDGYFLYLTENKMPLSDFELKLQQFLANITSDYVANIQNEQLTWDRLYRIDRDWKSWGEGEINPEIMTEFFQDLESQVGNLLEQQPK